MGVKSGRKRMPALLAALTVGGAAVVLAARALI